MSIRSGLLFCPQSFLGKLVSDLGKLVSGEHLFKPDFTDFVGIKIARVYIVYSELFLTQKKKDKCPLCEHLPLWGSALNLPCGGSPF